MPLAPPLKPLQKVTVCRCANADAPRLLLGNSLLPGSAFEHLLKREIGREARMRQSTTINWSGAGGTYVPFWVRGSAALRLATVLQHKELPTFLFIFKNRKFRYTLGH